MRFVVRDRIGNKPRVSGKNRGFPECSRAQDELWYERAYSDQHSYITHLAIVDFLEVKTRIGMTTPSHTGACIRDKKIIEGVCQSTEASLS